MTLLIKLAILLAAVALLVTVATIWSVRRARKREQVLRQRGPDATLNPTHPPQQKTDRWNISR